MICLGRHPCTAQQFTALHGSIYGGAANTYSQPAAGINMPYHWDVEVLGLNSFWNNNTFAFSATRWNWSKDSLGPHGHFIPGDRKRWATVQADVHLVNFLFRWPRLGNWVVGAGWNLHSRVYPRHLDYQYEDSIRNTTDFLALNAYNTLQQGSIVNQQWNEWYLTASTILRDNYWERLTAGATLKLLKGISAEVIDLHALSVGPDPSHTANGPAFTTASGRFGYSENLGELGDDNGFSESVQTLSNGAPLSPGLDIGITYTRKRQALIRGFTTDDPADYDWKLEAALTDIGRLSYPLGDLSAVVTGLIGAPNVNRFAIMMDSVKTLSDFKDSLSKIATLRPWTGSFTVSLPTALRINIDKSLAPHFYLNAQLVLDMSFLNPGVDYKVRQISYLMVSPRWETERVGVYVPVYVNGHGSLMAGAAIRLGPLVAGVHDFGWLRHATPTGGAYLSLDLRGLFKDKSECPSF